MINQLSTSRTLAIIFCFISLAAEAAQTPVKNSVPQPPESIREDSGSWRRDPFIGSLKKGDHPPTAKTIQQNRPGAALPKREQDMDIQLQGILQTGTSFHALINGRTVKAGDTFGAVTVKQISRYQAVLLNERNEKIIYDIYQGRIDRGKQ
ncbi:MAG: hypothetical protein WC007_01860 [Pelobacteraceae bacterium]